MCSLVVCNWSKKKRKKKVTCTSWLSSPRLFKLTYESHIFGKIAKFLLCLHPIPISSPPSQLLLLPSVYMFTGYLPFLFPLHHLSSPVRVVSSPWADLFMSNGCASCFFPSFFTPHHVCSKQAARQPAERIVLSHWMDGCIGGGG